MQHQITLLDGNSLTLQKIDTIIRQNHHIGLTQQSWSLVVRSRKAIADMIADPDKAVYGITTGFGSFANISISPELREKLQINLIKSHSVGVGNPVSCQVVKRMFVLRINTLAKGRSGIRPETLRMMIEAFNKNYLPLVPCQGTVGASGDLAPLSHLALGLLGEGKAFDFKTETYRPASEVMKGLGLQKITLKQKEGLALINGTQFMTAILSEVATKTQKLFQSSIVLYVFATQIFGVDKQLFSKQSQEFYSQFNLELSEIIQQIRSLVGQNQSQLHQARANSKEVHSLLDYPQALASILKTIRFTFRLLQEEMNSATDNPLVYFKQEGFQKDQLISAGNFHGEYVAKSADMIGFALFQIGKFSEARIQRYINGKISQLPPFLIKNGGLNSGFMISQYTTAALLSQSKVLVQPASVDSIVTSAGQQDHVSMGGFATRKCKMLLDNMSNILGIELLICMNSLNILQLKSSQRLMKIYNYLRTFIEPLEQDRYFGGDIQTASRLILHNLKMI